MVLEPRIYSRGQENNTKLRTSGSWDLSYARLVLGVVFNDEIAGTNFVTRIWVLSDAIPVEGKV